MATDVERIARSWIGTPYVHQASVKGVGCDCLGLLRGVWRELVGAEPEKMPPLPSLCSPTLGSGSKKMGKCTQLTRSRLTCCTVFKFESFIIYQLFTFVHMFPIVSFSFPS